MGKTVSIGNGTYINSNLTLVDDYEIVIGERVRRSTFDDRRNLKYMQEKEIIFQFVSGSLRVYFNRIFNMPWKPDRILSF